jgi:hypothetical protein
MPHFDGSFLPGAPAGLVAGTPEFQTWFRCPGGHKLIYETKKASWPAVLKVGKNGKV